MDSAWAMRGASSMPPTRFSSRDSSGANSSRIQASRDSVLSEYSPNRRPTPTPSLRLAKLRRPVARSSTTHRGILQVVSPVIGPTAPKL